MDNNSISGKIMEKMRQEGLEPYAWSNGPLVTYAAHEHPYHKVLYVTDGSIVFTLHGPVPKALPLKTGDRMDLPPNTSHSAVVGPSGVTCLEAQKPGLDLART